MSFYLKPVGLIFGARLGPNSERSMFRLFRFPHVPRLVVVEAKQMVEPNQVDVVVVVDT